MGAKAGSQNECCRHKRMPIRQATTTTRGDDAKPVGGTCRRAAGLRLSRRRVSSGPMTATPKSPASAARQSPAPIAYKGCNAAQITHTHA